MNKKVYILFLGFILSFGLFSSAFSQETLTITTYYPSPYGVYRELRSQRMAIGDNYYGSGYCWPPDICANQINADADLVVEGNVGIGVINPTYQLQLSLNSAAKPTSTAWEIPSDKRLKKDIEPFTDGLGVITRVNPVRYRLNGKANMPKDQEGISIIGQEMKEVASYTIKTFKAKLEPTDEKETELLSFDSSALTFVMVNAIKEQQKEIEELKSEIAGLRAQFKSRSK